MAVTVIFEEQVEIPLTIQCLADFRRWALSDDFPQRGRIDFVAGKVEVDMSPEDFFCHGTLKTEIVRVLGQRIKVARIGHLVCDRTRVSSIESDLSAEPDIVYLSDRTLAEDRARLIEKATGEPGRFVELEGAPDLIVEIVSDSSVTKDTQRLPKAYFKAGIGEFWLVDARGKEVQFTIHRPGETAYQPVQPDADGFQPSAVFNCGFRLDGSRSEKGHWTFDLLERE
jgi:Uma2 family endonuclease